MTRKVIRNRKTTEAYISNKHQLTKDIPGLSLCLSLQCTV